MTITPEQLEEALHQLGPWEDRCRCGSRQIALWPRLLAAVAGQSLLTYADELRARVGGQRRHLAPAASGAEAERS